MAGSTIGLYFALALAPTPVAAEDVPAAKLSHIHGLSLIEGDPWKLYIATHEGLYLAQSDGKARRISEARHDFMGLAANPRDRNGFYASGHPEGGGNLGVIASKDGGTSWQVLSSGAPGDDPVDFHALDVAKSKPEVLYGVHRHLQRSDDGAKTWRIIGLAPVGLIDLAVWGRDHETLFAATRLGLLRSRDGGSTWAPAHPAVTPVTSVETLPEGGVIAYTLDQGLLIDRTGLGMWERLAEPRGYRYLLHLTMSGSRAFALTDKGRILQSADGGRSWRPFGD
jgi:photosystem II stability/assembly factor-like uncharacterized protein